MIPHFFYVNLMLNQLKHLDLFQFIFIFASLKKNNNNLKTIKIMASISFNEMVEKLGKFKSVENMISPNGTTVPNQFLMKFENGEVLQSYSTFIGAKTNDGQKYISMFHDSSRTTNKYAKQFFNDDTKGERRAKIEGGQYTLVSVGRGQYWC